ncbi:MAG: aminotransferase class I/II-fold pyridoxal phosphate-dependent enzyme [Pelosinus sp.]|nr:aminotransferase class I/II-fold pyridoxal phosphate-dependent enzyme [Pelosinus sp.]
MTYSIAASHAKGKVLADKIFGASAAALKAAEKFGKAAVANATIGSFLDENEVLQCIPTVEQVYRNLPISELINYAPIAGLPEYLDAVIDMTFADSRPEGYTAAVATAGGTGVIHHTIANYSEIGDVVLTSDWYWGPYKILCNDALRKLETYTLFDENLKFNLVAFTEKVKAVLAKQDSVVIIINTPAHNPTGYSFSEAEWQQVLAVCKDFVKNSAKRITLLVDVAYLDFAGEKQAVRSFMKLFGGLPKSILGIFAFSMSKAFTMYGQRTGAMIGVSSSEDVITEFKNINKYTSRATWSNINRAAMRTLINVYQDKNTLAKVDAERSEYYNIIRERAAIFMREAEEAKLRMLPYRAGFFLSIPTSDSEAVCNLLHEDNIFAVPLAKGVRIAVCAVTKQKITGMASKVAKAVAAIEK